MPLEHDQIQEPIFEAKKPQQPPPQKRKVAAKMPKEENVIKIDLNPPGLLYANPNEYDFNFDSYQKTKASTKEEELEANIIRLDLEKAAKELALNEFKEKGWDTDMQSDLWLETYDKYYDILFKSKV